MRRPISRSFVVLAALGLATGAVAAAASPAQAQANETIRVTLYGYPDNSPPGRAIDCGQIHNEAGGTGTFDDPVTFATGHDQDGAMPCGTIIYVPYMKKYFIREDSCASCNGPWADLWAGGDQNSGQDILDCEDSLTRDNVDVIVNPGSGEDVDTTPIFDTSNGQCYQP
jgi:hypothetical protein